MHNAWGAKPLIFQDGARTFHWLLNFQLTVFQVRWRDTKSQEVHVLNFVLRRRYYGGRIELFVDKALQNIIAGDILFLIGINQPSFLDLRCH